MRFMLLLKGDERAEAGVLPNAQVIAAMNTFNDEMQRAGVLIAAEGLHPSSRGVRLRLVNDKLSITDGPFTETKELLAGFWVIQAPSKEAAIDWAKRCPLEADVTALASGAEGEIEIRQIFELEDFPVNPDESGWRESEAEFRAKEEEARSAEATETPVAAPAANTKRRYMMNMMADDDSEAGVLPSERLLAEMGSLMAEMASAGVLLAGEGLQASSKGAKVKFSAGKRTVIDGPFAETKELVAGYSLIQVDSKEEAIAWATRCIRVDAPGRKGQSTIELREIFTEADFNAAIVERAEG
ncbi:MAG TPA: YciI family protein [Thermomicrobiales bacterium]|jgi:hypothetical protein